MKGEDILKRLSDQYEKIIKKNYIYQIDGGIKLEIVFKKRNFPHLIGLHKLIDIPDLKKLSNKTGQADIVYRNIRNDKLTYEIISKSKHFSEIKDRIESFKEIDRILETSELIINFNKETLKKETKMETELKSNVILYTKIKEKYIHLCVVKSKGSVYPESFFPRNDNNYIKGQTKRNIIKKDILEFKLEKKGRKRKVSI